MSDFIIEKGVPLPSVTKRKKSRYPWAVMDIGDSVLFPAKEATRAKNSAAAYGTYHKYRFARETQPDGSTRIWRVS